MKFMTPASVRNLPQYLSDDRNNRLLRDAEAQRQEEKNSRKKFTEFTSRLQDVTMKAKSQEELMAGYDQIKQEFSPFLEPEWMQMGATAVRQWQDDQHKQEDRQKKLIDEKTMGADADAASRLLGQKAGFLSQGTAGGDEFSVPVSEQDLLLSMSPKGRLGMTETLLGYQGDQAKAQREAERDDLNRRNIESQIRTREMPNQGRPMSSADYKIAKDQAIADLSATLQMPIYPDETITLPPDQAAALVAEARAMGFPNATSKARTEGGGLFSSGEDVADVMLGAFRPEGATTQGRAGRSDQYQEAAQVVSQALKTGKVAEIAPLLEDLPPEDLDRVFSMMTPEERFVLASELEKNTGQQEEASPPAPAGFALPDSEQVDRVKAKKKEPARQAGGGAGAVDGRAPIVRFFERLMREGETGATSRRRDSMRRSFVRNPPNQ